jgi:NADH-quinone oxidoreductase subunit H
MVQMMLKEDFRPNSYDRVAYAIAHGWCSRRLLACSVIPFGGTLHPGVVPRWRAGSATASGCRIARLDAGLLSFASAA